MKKFITGFLFVLVLLIGLGRADATLLAKWDVGIEAYDAVSSGDLVNLKLPMNPPNAPFILPLASPTVQFTPIGVETFLTAASHPVEFPLNSPPPGTVLWSPGLEEYSGVDLLTGFSLSGSIFHVGEVPTAYGVIIDYIEWEMKGTDFLLSAEFTLNAYDRAGPVPEPATLLLFSAGLAGLGVFRKKFKKE